MLTRGSEAGALDRVITLEPWLASFREPLRDLLNRPRSGTAELDPATIVGLASARREATLGRWKAGPQRWHRWAAELRRLRQSPAIRLLSWLGAPDFSHHTFTEPVDFGAIPFPSGASFASAIFADEAWFSDVHFGGHADFSGAQFCRHSCFEGACFSGGATFKGAIFQQSARFTSIRALRRMTFSGAEFNKGGWLRYSQFIGPLDFSCARIGGEAGFGNAFYGEDSDFSHVIFADNAGFEQCRFRGKVSFAYASFARHARFGGSSFAAKPNFAATRFLGPRHFEETSMPLESPVARQQRVIAESLRQP